MKMHAIVTKFTEEEILKIDKVVNNEDVNKLANIIRQANKLVSEDNIYNKEAAFILAKAEENGQLDFGGMKRTICSCCGQSAGYAKVKRSGYKGRGFMKRYYKKGEDDLNKPLYCPIIVNGKALCRECEHKVIEALVKLIKENKPQIVIPQYFMTKHNIEMAHLEKYHWTKCKTCGWEGWGRELGLVRTLFCDGYFRGKCPKCGIERKPLGVKCFETDYKKSKVMEAEKTSFGRWK